MSTEINKKFTDASVLFYQRPLSGQKFDAAHLIFISLSSECESACRSRKVM